MHRTLWSLAFVLFLHAAPAWAQEVNTNRPPDYDLAVFDIGQVLPYTVELDGNPGTVEWMTVDLEGRHWVLNLGTQCKEYITTTITPPPLGQGTFIGYYFTNVGNRLWIITADIDPSDGKLPVWAEPVRSVCYPESMKR